MEKVEITIIGAGVVGLAVCSVLAERGKNVLLLERHSTFGQETSSRNSEVIHAGIYYPKNSLKGKLCLEGNEIIYDICKKNHIPFKNTGKLIVAVNEEEAAKLPPLFELASGNGAKDVRIIDSNEIKKIEPNVTALVAIYCPTSGIVDSHSLMRYFETVALQNEANIVYGVEVNAIYKRYNGYEVDVIDNDKKEFKFFTNILINCAGLESSNISAKAGIDIDEADYRIKYLKGIYFRVMRGLEKLPKTLIYPVPPISSLVGIHTCPDIAGGMRLGPYCSWVDKIDY